MTSRTGAPTRKTEAQELRSGRSRSAAPPVLVGDLEVCSWCEEERPQRD